VTATLFESYTDYVTISDPACHQNYELIMEEGDVPEELVINEANGKLTFKYQTWKGTYRFSLKVTSVAQRSDSDDHESIIEGLSVTASCNQDSTVLTAPTTISALTLFDTITTPP
jgi:hypothetical protein